MFNIYKKIFVKYDFLYHNNQDIIIGSKKLHYVKMQTKIFFCVWCIICYTCWRPVGKNNSSYLTLVYTVVQIRFPNTGLPDFVWKQFTVLWKADKTNILLPLLNSLTAFHLQLPLGESACAYASQAFSGNFIGIFLFYVRLCMFAKNIAISANKEWPACRFDYQLLYIIYYYTQMKFHTQTMKVKVCCLKIPT